MSESPLPLTVLIAVFNEERNIEKCLASLKLAERVIVLDSHSSDRTAAIARGMGTEVIQFDYNGRYPKKRQWAMSALDIRSEWILLVDADEVVPPMLWDDIRGAIISAPSHDAYLITKGFHFLGKRFRFGGFSFAAVGLLRRGKAHFEHLLEDDPATRSMDMEVHERLIVDGSIGTLKTPLIHEDFKDLQAYIDRHNRYSTWEAHLRYHYFRKGSYGQDTIQPQLLGNTQERRRFLKKIVMRVPFESWLWFGYHYLLKLGCLEGRRGLIACQIRAAYISQVRAKIYELRQTVTDLKN